MNRVIALVSDFNALARKKNLKSRILYNIETGHLFLGCEEQFMCGTSQCVLASGSPTVLGQVVSSMLKTLCFEVGE